MATNVGSAAKDVILNDFKTRFTLVQLLNAANGVISVADVAVGTWTLSGNTLSNSAAIKFDVTISGVNKIAAKVNLFPAGHAADTDIIIDLTGVDIDPNKHVFATTGTFTIPAGDLTITVA